MEEKRRFSEESALNVLVVDGQGGMLGKQMVEAVRKLIPNAEITAVGTNTMATASMLKAGADNGATGENSVVVAVRSADIIVGPIGIVIADSLLGEITPAMIARIKKGKTGEVVFEKSKSVFLKTLKIRRIFDEESQTLMYLSYSTRETSGSFKHSLSTVPLWGTAAYVPPQAQATNEGAKQSDQAKSF